MGVLPDYIFDLHDNTCRHGYKKKTSASLLSGIIWVILSVICERTVSTGEIIAGILAGAFFLLISKLTKESFGYGDSILIVIMGAFLGFWSLMSVLFMAFFMAGLFSVIMLLKTKFHKKSCFALPSLFDNRPPLFVHT